MLIPRGSGGLPYSAMNRLIAPSRSWICENARDRFALFNAALIAGIRTAARMPMMVITTSSSINVKPRADCFFLFIGIRPFAPLALGHTPLHFNPTPAPAQSRTESKRSPATLPLPL
jgi:hypothetical protein